MGKRKLILKFVGIDCGNRPVFKDTKKRNYYGDTEHLFSMDSTERCVLEKYQSLYETEDISEILHKNLVYFGRSFNCEPNGGEILDSVEVILKDHDARSKQLQKILENAEWLESHNKNYTKEQYYRILEILESAETALKAGHNG